MFLERRRVEAVRVKSPARKAKPVFSTQTWRAAWERPVRNTAADRPDWSHTSDHSSCISMLHNIWLQHLATSYICRATLLAALARLLAHPGFRAGLAAFPLNSPFRASSFWWSSSQPCVTEGTAHNGAGAEIELRPRYLLCESNTDYAN